MVEEGILQNMFVSFGGWIERNRSVEYLGNELIENQWEKHRKRHDLGRG